MEGEYEGRWPELRAIEGWYGKRVQRKFWEYMKENLVRTNSRGRYRT